MVTQQHIVQDNLTAVMGMFAAVPSPRSEAPPGVSDKIGMIMNWVVWGAYAACVFGIISFAVGMIMNHRRGGGADGGGLIVVGLAAILIGASATLVNKLSGA